MHSIELERHLHDCPLCERLNTARMELRTKVQGASMRYRAPSSLERKVQAAITLVVREEGKFEWLRFRWPSIVTTAAAIALIGFLSLRPPEGTIEQAVIDSHVRSLMTGHLMDQVPLASKSGSVRRSD